MTVVPLNDLNRLSRATATQIAAAFARVNDRGIYILGPENGAFEAEFAEFCGVTYGVGVACGTDALELALRACGVMAGDVVATVSNAGFYSSTALLAIGAIPAFVDVDADTQVMTSATLLPALETQPVRCVIVTHLYGRLAEIEPIIELCGTRNIPVLEDCAQAHGAARNGRSAGSFGAAGCFSFYPTKNLGALGDGGAVITCDISLAERVRALRQYGWREKYQISCLGGRNSRLDEIQAAVLRERLPFVDEWNSQRRAIAKRYSSEIANSRVTCPSSSGDNYVAHLYVVRSEQRDKLREHLFSEGIASDVHYPTPDHHQIPFKDVCRTTLSVTESLATQVLTLPCFPYMREDEVSRVIEAVNSW